MQSLASLLALLWVGSIAVAPTAAFAPRAGKVGAPQMHANGATQQPRRYAPALSESNNDDGPGASGNEAANDTSPFQRFLSPKIDDPGLPLTDVLLAQIVAPTFEIYWLALSRAPNPSWLLPISSYFGEAPELAPRGSLLAPALIHGAGLAVCWLAGALAARMYEREAFTVKGYDSMEEGSTGVLDTIGRYDTILIRLVQAGAFASGILILSTQLDLLLEFGRYIQYGESESTDLRLLVGTVEVINDIFWEALVLSSWRIIHANFMSTPSNWTKRF